MNETKRDNGDSGLNGENASTYLKQLCQDIDAGREPRRFNIRSKMARVAVPALMGLSSLGLVGCIGHVQPNSTPDLPDVIVIRQPPRVEVCNDGYDNDADGTVDCADLDCRETPFCMQPVALYAVVMPPQREICGDGLDNDRDGRTDCADSDCQRIAMCAMPVPAYAVPPPVYRPEICSDGIDNDRDGMSDCGDPDCHGDEACMAMPEYGVPFDPPEICHDRIDNDGDGAIDCADSDCGCAIALYGIPPMNR